MTARARGSQSMRLAAWVLSAALLLGMAGGATADDGPLKERSASPIALSHSVVGKPWCWPEFSGTASLLIFFEASQADFGSTVVPVLQKMKNRFTPDPRFRAFVVLTSATPEKADVAAEDRLVKDVWGQEKWDVRIMRDDGNKSYLHFVAGPQTRLPLAVMFGSNGAVRWQGGVGSPEELKEVEKAIEGALNDFEATDIKRGAAGMKASESAWRARDFAKAWKEVQKVLTTNTPTDTDKDQARTMLDEFQTVADLEISLASARRAGGMPHDAQKLLERAARILKDVPPAKNVESLLKTWKTEAEFQRQLEGEDKIDRALQPLLQPDPDRAAAVAALEKIAQTYSGTGIATRATELATLVK